MKKLIKLSLIFTFFLLLSSCHLNTSEYILPNEKPTPYYYSNEIYRKLKTTVPYTLKIFDLNTYTHYDVSPNEPDFLIGFFESLKLNDYTAHEELYEPSSYKIIIEFTDSRFVIDVIDKNLVTIHPWDGIFTQDIISISNVSTYYNPYNFCEYIKKISKDI